MKTPTQLLNVTKWVKELRSGKYPQTQGYLNLLVDLSDQKAGFCCLGVLCEVFNAPKNKTYGSADQIQSYFADGNSTTPDIDWFTEVTGFSPDFMVMLARINDAGASFEVIANIIEATLSAEKFS